MKSLELALRLAGGILLILANGFFVAIEFGLTRARQYSREEFVGDGNAALERAWEMTQDLEVYLTTCQVGITASSIAVGIVAEPALAALFEPLVAGSGLAGVGAGALVAFLVINLVHLTHGEQTPTYLGVERSRLVCRYGASPLYWFHYAIAPLIRFGDAVAKWTLGLFGVEMSGSWLETEERAIESRADLRNRVGSILEEGGLSDERRQEVMNALEVDEKEVREEMVPAEEVVALSTEVDTEENLRRMAENPHTRYPLVGEDISAFEGVVYVPVLARHHEALGDGSIEFPELATPPMTVQPETAVSDAFDRFQTENQELALVGEAGDVVGLVTVTDLLESVMGDVEDPLDRNRPDVAAD